MFCATSDNPVQKEKGRRNRNPAPPHTLTHLRTYTLTRTLPFYALQHARTVEIEHVNCDVLDELEAEGTVIHPSPKCIRIIQDKWNQKNHFQSYNVQSIACVCVCVCFCVCDWVCVCAIVCVCVLHQ